MSLDQIVHAARRLRSAAYRLPITGKIRRVWSFIVRLTSPIFPEVEIYSQVFSWRKKLLFFVVLVFVFALIGMLVPPGGYVGFDWTISFGKGNIHAFYPPWTKFVVSLLTWPLLIGLGIAAFGLAAAQRSNHPVSLAAAFICLPLVWTIFLGQIEGIVLLGLVGLPWLAPLALLKPQVAIFAFGARRSYLVAFLIVMLLSFLIFGPWWNSMLNIVSTQSEVRAPQNIGLGWYGLPLFLATIWFSRGDMDMLMLSGAFITPYLIPYALLPLTPAIARLRPIYALTAVLLSWLPLVCANYFGSWGWWTGWLFPLFLWSLLAINRYRQKKMIPDR